MALPRLGDVGIVLRDAERLRQRDSEPVHPRPEHGEHRRQDGHREEEGRRDGDDAADAHAPQRRCLEHRQRREADGHRHARDQHGLADAAHHPLQSDLDRVVAQLLAEAADHEQRVVDGEREADHARQVRDEDAHVGHAREERDDRERRRQRKNGRQQRQGRSHERAEDREQDDERERQADQLGLDEVLLDLLVELVVELRDAGHGHLDARGRLDLRREVRRAIDRVLVGLGEGHDAERHRAVMAQQLLGAGVGVGGDLGHQRVVGNRLERVGHDGLELRAGGVAVGIGEEDDHARRGLAEAVREERLRLLLLGALDHPSALDERAAGDGAPGDEAHDDRNTHDGDDLPEPIHEAPECGERAGRMRLARAGRGCGRRRRRCWRRAFRACASSGEGVGGYRRSIEAGASPAPFR